MRSLYVLLFLTFTSLSFAQDWQEHLAHDKQSITLGQHLDDDGLSIVTNNFQFPSMVNFERVVGNVVNQKIDSFPYFEWRSKYVQTGIGKKQIKLFEPWDYDINGFGIVSIRFDGTTSTLRHAGGMNDFSCGGKDGLIPQNVEENYFIQCFSGLGEYDKDDNLIDLQENLENVVFHEGLDGQQYAIINNNFGTFENGSLTVLLDSIEYTNIYNDPYRNRLVLLGSNGTTLSFYDYVTFQLEDTHELISSPFGLKFYEDGYRFLINEPDQRIIYSSGPNAADNTPIFTSEKEDILFIATDFEISDSHVYYSGTLRDEILGINFSHVEKRSLSGVFDPNRKDIRIDSVSINQTTFDDPWASYSFNLYVTNVGNEPLDNFSVYSKPNNLFDMPFSVLKETFTESIDPGEGAMVSGTFFSYQAAYIDIGIPGVDFGLDANPEDNYIRADVITSTKERLFSLYKIFPNPSSDILTITGPTDNSTNYSIHGIDGRFIRGAALETSTIDITQLEKGHYVLTLESDKKEEKHRFIKI